MKMNYIGNKLVKKKKTSKIIRQYIPIPRSEQFNAYFFKLHSFIRQKRQILSRRKLVVQRLFDYLINEVK